MNNVYQPLKRTIFLIATIFLAFAVNGQSLSNYVFSTDNTSSLNRTAGSLIDDIDMNTGTTILIGGSQNNATSPLNPIGFDYFINGVRQTQFNVTSNGWVGIGSFASPVYGFLNVAAGVRLAPFLGSATTGIGTSSIGRIHYKVVGTQPNRVLVVEFLRMAINATVVNDTNTFQVRLYESNGAFEYVYGRMNATISTALNFNVGFQFSSTLYNNVNFVTHTVSSTNSSPVTLSSSGYINNVNGSTPGSQRSYTWTPNPPDDPGVISISNITTSSMTVSWVNASNELGYALYRSIDGGVTYTWVTNIPQNVTTYNAIGLLANTLYNWKVYSYRESISPSADGSASTLPSGKFFTIASGNWSNPSTWNTNSVPGSQDSAEVSVGDNVVLDAATQSCGTLIVKGTLTYWNASAAQTLTVNGDVLIDATGNFNAGSGSGNAGTSTSFILNIGGSAVSSTLAGNLVVDGILDLSNTAEVQTVFYGTQNSTITGSGSTCEMPFISVNKGLINNTLEVLRVFTQPSASNYTFTQRLTAISGTLKISAPVVTTSFHSNQLTLAPSINSRLWLNHPGISLGMRPGVLNIGTLQLQGEVRVDEGSLTAGTGSNNHFATTNGVLRINGGTVTIKGAFQLVGIASSQLIVNGGRLLMDPQDLQNLSNFINILSIPSSSSFTFTGGSIEILDPHSTAPTSTTIASINIQSGGTRVITGGRFVIGSGLSAPSGGVFSNASGFGILSAVPLPKLYINNNISVSASRFCRLMANTTITDSLVISSNGYLFTGSGLVGYNLGVSGHIENNGTIAGTTPSATGNGVGALNIEGTSAQEISGSGSAVALSVKIANALGVSFSNSNAWALERITMETGNVTNAPTSITIGGATYRGSVTIGGLNETTTAGSFSVIPTFNTTFGNPSFIYGPAANTLQTGSFNEVPAGGTTVVNLTVNDAQGLTVNRNVNVTGTLALTAGVLNMGTNSLTLGVSVLATGTLTRTSGLVQLASSGSFTRWYSTANSPAFDYALGFPLTTGTRERSVLLNLNGGFFSAGGSLTVRHGNTVGYTDISPTFTDGTTTIDRRTNAYWLLSSTATPNIGLGNTLSIRLVGEGVGSITDVTQLKIVKSSSLYSGTTVDGSGTIITPFINRDFSQPTVLGGGIFDTMYVGSNSSVNPILPNIIAINTGLWNDVNTWEGGIIPTSSNSATIATGVNVTIPAAYTASCNGLSIMTGGTLTASAGTLNNSANLTIDGDLIVSGATVNVTGSAGLGLTISSTGSVNLSSGTLTIGAVGGNNRTLLSSGTLTVSNGTLNLNGNLNLASGSTFNQTGGNINVDGNSGLSATSTASSVHLVSINTNNINCSAGTITIVDPPHSSITANSTMSLRITASSSLSAFTGTHTFAFGNGTSAEAGNTNGFVIDVRRSGLLPLQNVLVNAGNGSGRWVSTSYSTGNFGAYIKGNLTINSGSEFRHVVASTFAVGGDIINNGTLTVANTMTLGGNAYYPISNAQAISGTGTFRNNATTPTASFVSVNLDNGVGLTLNTSAVTFAFSGAFNIGATKVTTGNNIVSLTSSGSIVRTSGYVVGNLSKNVAVGSNIARTYEIGNASSYLPVTVTFPSVTTAGNVSIGIKDGDHPQLSSSCINTSKSINRYWTVTNVSSVNTGGNYTFNFTTGDVDAGTVLASTKLFSYNGSAWLAGVTGTTTTTSFAVTGLTNYGDIAIGEITPLPASVSIAASSNNICVGTNVTFTATVTNGGTAPTYQWKVNGINTVTTSTFASSTLNNNDVVTCVVVSNSPCVSVPSVTSNAITMTVAPLTVAGSVTGGANICAGSNSGLLTLAGYTGSIVRWESAVAPFSTFNPITNTTATYTSGALTQTTQFRAVVQSGSCASANSTTTIVTVDPATVAGSISGTNAVCSGLSAGNLTLSGNTGSVVRWESAVSPFSTFTPIANTTTTQSAGSPTQTIHYRAVVQSGSCAPVTTTAFIITVTPSSVGGTVSSNQTICAGSPVTQLTLAGQTGVVTKWQSANNVSFTGATDIPATAGLTAYTPTSVTSTTYYRAVVQSGTCAVANSASALITVNPAPVAGSLSGTNAVCSGNSPGALTLSGQTGAISFWQSNSGGGWVNISNTTTTYNPGALTLTTQFRVVVGSGGGCAADTTLPFVVTVTPSSVGGTVSSNQTICVGSPVATLNLTGQTGTVTKWQSANDPAFSTPIDIAGTAGFTSYTPVGVSSSTYYRAVVTSGGCTPANSVAAFITVNTAPVAGTLGGTNAVCSGNSPGNLTLSGQTGIISFWQSKTGASWVNISNTTTTYNPGALTVTTQFRVVVGSGGACPADTTTAFTVTVTPASVGGSVSAPQTICAGGPVSALTLTGQTGTVDNWQSSSDVLFTTPTDIVGTAGLTSYTPTSVTATTYFRAKVTSGGCATAFSSSVLITVNSTAVAGTLGGTNAVCAGNSPGNLTLSGQTGTISFWQSNTGSGWVNISNTTTTYNPGVLTVSTSFRVVVASGLCPADTTPAFAVTVTPATVGGSVSANQTICVGDPVASLSLTGHVGSIVKWQSATNPSFTGASDIPATSGLTSYTPTSLPATTYFRAVIQSGTCAIVNSSSVTITVNPAALAGTVTGTTPICSGSSSTLFLSGQVGTITKWQVSTNAPLFNTWTDIANTTTSLSTGTLTQTTRYRAEVTSGSCAPVTSNEFEVAVTSSGIWTGVVNGNWNNAGNWCGGVPTASTNVVIPSGTLNAPVININNATANNITVDAGATLAFTGSGNVLDIKGDLTVNGTFNGANGMVIYSGTAAQNVAGVAYAGLRMNGLGTKSLTGNATVSGGLDLVSGNLQLGSFNLIIGSSATAGGNSSSYIVTNGSGSYTISSLGSTARIFGVGTATSYTPLLIANNGTADDISVKILQGVYNSYVGEVGSGAPISLNVVNKTFIINEATTGGSSLDITFNWNGSDESGLNRTQTIVGRYNGGVWSNISGAAAAASGSNPYTFNITGVTNLGILGVGDINSPLPVRLVSFTAKLKKGLTNLAWTTASELNNNYFEVERSSDGYNFTAIGIVKAKGNSNSRFDYTFVDQESANLLGSANVLYYRLKQYDMSGHSDKSNVVSVNLFGTAVFEVVSTVPNPFNTETVVSFKTSSNSIVDVQLNDAFGKLIKTETMMPTVGSNSYHVELNNEFAPGVYFVKITQDGVSKVVKVIKR